MEIQKKEDQEVKVLQFKNGRVCTDCFHLRSNTEKGCTNGNCGSSHFFDLTELPYYKCPTCHTKELPRVTYSTTEAGDEIKVLLCEVCMTDVDTGTLFSNMWDGIDYPQSTKSKTRKTKAQKREDRREARAAKKALFDAKGQVSSTRRPAAPTRNYGTPYPAGDSAKGILLTLMDILTWKVRQEAAENIEIIEESEGT